MSYCIAFSIDGATDVTRRYVRDEASYGLPRTRVSEEFLSTIIKSIRSKRREQFSIEAKAKLIKEDMREEKELRMYVVRELVAQLPSNLEIFANEAPAESPKILDERRRGKLFRTR